jgi:hypothetical protein
MDDDYSKSSVISFRIDSKTKDLLEAECALENVPVNQTLNKIVQKHLTWDKFAKEIGLIFISKSIFRNMLAKLSDKEIKVLATTICRGTLKDATIFMKGDLNCENFLEIVDMWFTNSHIPFRKIVLENQNKKYIIQHELGLKYSTYLFTAIITLLSELGYSVTNKQLEDNTLIFEICKLN